MSTLDGIVIKGTRDGLLVTLGGGALEQLLEELNARLSEKAGFFEGARVIVQAGDRSLSTADLTAIQVRLAQHNMTLWAVLGEAEDTRATARGLGLATKLGSATAASRSQVPEPPSSGATVPAFMRPGGSQPAPAVAEVTPPAPAQAAPAQPTVPFVEDGLAGVLVRRTLRAGQGVRYAGAVIVLGDVNPGAEIIAGGDVIIWGKLRGVVHAGAMGDENAVVCALDLAPTQLRIAGHIATTPPDSRRNRRPVAEIARIQAGQIVAVSWNPK